MKLVCPREKFLSAFQTASAVAPSRSPKPVLQSVKLEVREDATVLSATDLEIGVQVQVAGVDAQVPGTALLPIRELSRILRESSDDALRIEADGQGVQIYGQHSEFRLPAANPDEFPSLQSFQETSYHEITGAAFRELIRRTVFATDNESSRYALGGVLLEMGEDSVIAVGTDGRRLARMGGPAKCVGDQPVADTATIVPTKAMQLMERATVDDEAAVQVVARANDVLVHCQHWTIYSRLVEGRFPKWRDVFPKRTDAVQLDLVVGPIFAAVRQADIVTSDESRGVDFTFGDGKLVLAASTAEVGQSRIELPISYDAAPITVTLDPKFLIDFLRVLPPDSGFRLEVKDAGGAVVCQTEDDYGYVIMPLARDSHK